MMARLRHCTMSEENQISDTEDLQERLAEVQVLLARHKLVEDLVHRQEGPRHDLVEGIVHKQHLNELQARLAPMRIGAFCEFAPLQIAGAATPIAAPAPSCVKFRRVIFIAFLPLIFFSCKFR